MQTMPADAQVAIVFLLEKKEARVLGCVFWVQIGFTSLDMLFQNTTPEVLRASSAP